MKPSDQQSGRDERIDDEGLVVAVTVGFVVTLALCLLLWGSHPRIAIGMVGSAFAVFVAALHRRLTMRLKSQELSLTRRLAEQTASHDERMRHLVSDLESNRDMRRRRADLSIELYELLGFTLDLSEHPMSVAPAEVGTRSRELALAVHRMTAFCEPLYHALRRYQLAFQLMFDFARKKAQYAKDARLPEAMHHQLRAQCICCQLLLDALLQGADTTTVHNLYEAMKFEHSSVPLEELMSARMGLQAGGEDRFDIALSQIVDLSKGFPREGSSER